MYNLSLQGREAELDMLRRDIHRMQNRAEEVERSTKMMIGAIEEFVDRRENLVDKAVSLATSRTQNITPQTVKSLLGKKIEDAKCRVTFVEIKKFEALFANCFKCYCYI